MCPTCGDASYIKRNMTKDVSDKYALIIGARLKLGYQTALKLLA